MRKPIICMFLRPYSLLSIRNAEVELSFSIEFVARKRGEVEGGKGDRKREEKGKKKNISYMRDSIQQEKRRR